MASVTRVEVPGSGLDRRRAMRYALGAVAGAVAMPVLAACGGSGAGNSSSSAAPTSTASSVSMPAPLPASYKSVWPIDPAKSQVAVPGSMYAVKGAGSTMELELSAFGNDIWNTADNFAFYGNQASGDGQWSVQVAIQAATDGWAKAGLVMRQTLDAGSVMIDLVTTPQNGVNCQYRLVKNMGCPGTNGPQIDSVAATPIYLRMTKKGTTLTVEDSVDGSKWNNTTQLTFKAPDPKSPTAWPKGTDATKTVPTISDPYYIGVCACAHNAKLRGRDGFANITGLKNPKYSSVYNKSATYAW